MAFLPKLCVIPSFWGMTEWFDPRFGQKIEDAVQLLSNN